MVPIVDPEELATIAGIENDNTLFIVSENSYRMFHNLLYDTKYPLRYAHIFMVEPEEALEMTQDLICSMRSRAVRGAATCISFLINRGLK
jgi:hypothetical protein